MIEVTCGVLVAISIYLLLEKALHRKIFGFVLLSTTVNLILLFAGRLTHKQPAFVELGLRAPYELSNPVPQALILTAIVIGFGLLVFLCVLLKVAKKEQP